MVVVVVGVVVAASVSCVSAPMPAPIPIPTPAPTPMPAPTPTPTRRLPPPLLRRLPAPTLSGRRHIEQNPPHALQPDDVQAARRAGRGPERGEAALFEGEAGRVGGGVGVGRGLTGGIGERGR